MTTVINYSSMVIDYNSVKMSFCEHGNRLQDVIIDYISVKHVTFEKRVIDYDLV